MDKQTRYGLAAFLVCLGAMFGTIAYGSGAMSVVPASGPAVAGSFSSVNVSGTTTPVNGIYMRAAGVLTLSASSTPTLELNSSREIYCPFGCTMGDNGVRFGNMFESGTYTTNIASGSNAFAVETNGARIDYGSGASDYASSDGTNVNFAGPVTATAFTVTGGVVNVAAGSNFRLNSRITADANAPTLGSGWGTSPSMVNSNGTASFQINVGAGGAATSGTITMPSSVTNGWTCICNDLTNPTKVQSMSANSVNSCTITTSAAWAANDKLWCIAMGN